MSIEAKALDPLRRALADADARVVSAMREAAAAIELAQSLEASIREIAGNEEKSRESRP